MLTDTEVGLGGTGDTGDTGNAELGECWTQGAPAGAVRWQCKGLAEATILATLDVDVPDIGDTELIQRVIDGGRFDWRERFGPWPDQDEAYDEPGVDACCLPDIAGNDEEGEDETGADADDDGTPPQAAEGCARDCADQACRQIPDKLRELMARLPAGIPVVGPSYRDQLRDLANWVAAHQQDCWAAMVADGVYELAGNYVVEGEWAVPDNSDWPAITDLSVRGQCKVFDWLLPADGEPMACTGINDNNDEDPFGSGGSLGEFDTFAPTTGRMQLDGPVVFGVDADGSAPLLGLGDSCPRGECSRIDAWITPDALELRHLLLAAPSTLRWEREGMLLAVDGLHVQVEHPLSIPLVADADVMRFELPAGALELLVAGRVHGVPLALEVPNATPVTGMVFRLFDGSHGIVIDPFTVEHHDAFGTWAMRVELGELVGVEHAPRVSFVVEHDGSTQRLDASASFDPDGDGLGFEWHRDGVRVGEGVTIESEVATDGSLPTLVVIDETGRIAASSMPTSDGL